jgi:hypothetical protein
MLTELATVKARLDIPPATTTYDALLTRAIEAVSARFDRECNRTLARTVGDTQEFRATDREIIARCYPIETVTKFELKTTEADGWLEQVGAGYVIRHSCTISLSTPLTFVPEFLWGSPFRRANRAAGGPRICGGRTGRRVVPATRQAWSLPPLAQRRHLPRLLSIAAAAAGQRGHPPAPAVGGLTKDCG